MQLDESSIIFKYIKLKEISLINNSKAFKIEVIKKPRLITTPEEKTNILRKYPIFGGHFGKKKLFNKIKDLFYWENLKADIAKHIDACKCRLNKPKIKTREPMVITNTPGKAFDTVIIDTIGPLPLSESENRYAVTIMCDLTKYLITIPIKTKDAYTVAKAIVKSCILVYGLVKTVLTDQGTEYKNQVWNEVCKILEIEHKTSTAYHYQTLGTVERNHRVFNEYLRSYLNEFRQDWDEYLTYFTYCHNTTPDSAFDDKYSPYELLFGRTPTLPHFLEDESITAQYNFESYAQNMKNDIKRSNTIARNLLKASKTRNNMIRIVDDLTLN